ncbi:penicillin-binding protein [Ichthyenterobacterium sp. W332]|uniref:Penicillin-binding protein n=1 Tax=Microcosmobacter mediterraneus TaxID=3075607 RepID=A0ABU2YJX5_9FLAO|nr:penicillin-binding protein [Ichthyenterobacterium sp. W332]MDT0558472.1 penicillin-binding protein [Ichthyenterobacterium sp. W332]
MFVFVLAVVFKLVSIQFIQGDKYRDLAEERTIKDVEILPNRGNVYSADGSLLATSVPKYDIRLDAITPSNIVFNEYLKPLCDSLSKFSRKPSSYYQNEIQKARKNKNRYFLLARNLGYSDYIRFRNFPMLSLGAFKGGLIVEQKTKREHPMGEIALRSIGYERFDDDGNVTRAGLDGAFGEQYLRGKSGHRLKQKIGKGQWKPIRDNNEVEPQDGYDIYTTIDINIQDIAHHALLEQLEFYKADHGCVVVMETKTGEIRAISNLGRNKEGKYYERLNYAVGESHEPGSTFKLMALAVALDDKVIDTSDVVDTEKGILTYYGKKVRDSRNGGYGKISVAKALEVSSNTGIVKAIHNSYTNNPKKFVDGLYDMNLNETLDLPIIGEGKPIIPDPRIKNKRWSGIALEWMAYGYGVSFTPLQTLTFYNAIANKGEMVRPLFLREVREFDKTIESFDKKVINKQVCSKETVKKLKQLLVNVVEKKHGTGHGLYSENFSMAGKTGTCQKDYRDKEKLNYISSFAGFFPAENPEYSCIVVIHEPDKSVGYYGADVSGPVFKKIAQKIYTDTPLIDEVETLNVANSSAETQYEQYYDTAQKYKTIMPNVKGMPTMDALALLENMGLKVKINGIGVVKNQSVAKGVRIKKNQTIELTI